MEGNENNSSGLDTSNKDNSDDNKNKKTKQNHSTINSSSFSEFPSYMRFDLERRSHHSIFTKSSINHKKTELEIAKLNARNKASVKAKRQGALQSLFR